MADNPAAGDLAGSGGGGTSKLVLIGTLVNMVATIGIMVVLLMSHQNEKAQPSVDDIVKGQAEGAGAHGSGGAPGGGSHGSGGHGGGAAPGAGAPVADAGKIQTLEPFMVNLTTGAGTAPRYVRMNVSIEMEEGAQEKEFEVKLPKIRDTIINLLNSKKAAELNTVEGREQLKSEIKRSINGFLLQSKAKGVYFTNFAISN